jgi:hypothetical protein
MIWLPHIMLYIDRPVDLKTIRFQEYFEQYEVRKRGQGNCSYGDLHNKRDRLGNKVYKLHQPRVIKLTDFSPQYHSNNFFYKFMVCYEPFDKVDYLTAIDGNYYNECIRRGIIKNSQRVRTST